MESRYIQPEEVALTLTLKAMEHKLLKDAVEPLHSGKKGDEVLAEWNSNSAKEIAKFYNTILHDVRDNS